MSAAMSIAQGNRPPRPVHPSFTVDLWSLMQLCWDQHPHSRPEAAGVLQALLVPSSDADRAAETDASGRSGDKASDAGMFPPFCLRFQVKIARDILGTSVPRRGDGLPVLPLDLPPRTSPSPHSNPRARRLPPSDITGTRATHSDDYTPVARLQGSSEGLVGKVARDAREALKYITRKFPRS